MHYLTVLADTCGSLLRTAHPLHTIFGPYYRPETVVEQRIRSLLPSPIRPNIPGTSTGIRMERQQYFTNTILREELMKLNNVRSCVFQRQTRRVGGCLTMSVLHRRPHQINMYVKGADER